MGELLTNKNQLLAGWKEYIEEHLNEGTELEQPTRFERWWSWHWPSREEIEGALKYLKNNKAAGFYRGRAVEELLDLFWWMHYMQWSSRPRLARHKLDRGGIVSSVQ
jgi:hypothetical protein